MKTDLSQLLKPYEDKWVAISPDYKKVIASGETLKETVAQVSPESREEVIFHKVLPYDALYAPLSL